MAGTLLNPGVERPLLAERGHRCHVRCPTGWRRCRVRLAALSGGVDLIKVLGDLWE